MMIWTVRRNNLKSEALVDIFRTTLGGIRAINLNKTGLPYKFSHVCQSGVCG